MPTDLGKLLADIRARIGDVSEDEVRKAIKCESRGKRADRDFDFFNPADRIADGY